MTKQKLTINLDEIKNPPKAVLKAYKEANAEHLHFMHIPAYVNEERIFLHSKASGVPIRHLITHLYRKQTAGGKEYCFFGEQLFSKDYFKNDVSHFRTVGKYLLPIISKTYALNPGRILGNSDINKMMEAQEQEVGVSETKEIFEFSWTEIRPQLEQWYHEGIINDESQLYVIVGNNKYGKPFTWDEWLNLDIPDLIVLSRLGPRYQELLKGQELTPEILKTIREKLQAETIEQLAKK